MCFQPTRYSLGATQIQGAQTRLPTLILPCITPCIFKIISVSDKHSTVADSWQNIQVLSLYVLVFQYTWCIIKIKK